MWIFNLYVFTFSGNEYKKAICINALRLQSIAMGSFWISCCSGLLAFDARSWCQLTSIENWSTYGGNQSKSRSGRTSRDINICVSPLVWTRSLRMTLGRLEVPFPFSSIIEFLKSNWTDGSTLAIGLEN